MPYDYSQLAEDMVQTNFQVLPYIYGIFFWFCPIESLGHLKKVPTWYAPIMFFLKTVSVTVVGTRTSHFRDVVAKAKRCIFLHIIYEKLILGPYEEVHISAFFKKPFGLQGEVPERANLERQLLKQKDAFFYILYMKN